MLKSIYLLSKGVSDNDCHPFSLETNARSLDHVVFLASGNGTYKGISPLPRNKAFMQNATQHQHQRQQAPLPLLNLFSCSFSHVVQY